MGAARAWRWCVCALAVAALAAPGAGAGASASAGPGASAGARQAPRYSSRIVHTHAGAIRGVIVSPASRRLEPVEAFLGVPYASPPPRLGPPPAAPAPAWPGTRLADEFAPVCPQHVPDVTNRSLSLSRMPLGVYRALVALTPLLANQSEDCLHLNIYVPGSGARGVEAPYAVVAWLGAPALDWGSANAIDGAVLAARAHVLVVTINYRVGLLGFLTSGLASDPAHAAGGAGVLDVVAALRWVRRNIAAFGGDPRRVTVAGHAAGAALAGALLMLPDTKGLLSRVLLLSGSPLSPGALSPDPALARQHAAQALRCPRDAAPGDHWLVRCVRARPLGALLAVDAPRARFLAGWAPAPASPAGAGAAGAGATRALHASEAFLECALALVVTSTESYEYFAEDDIRHGFEEEHRSRVLRTFVRNAYRYHRNEILAAVRNEYTDWARPIQHPINIRDAALEALSDASAAAPALRLAQLHARRGQHTYFAHLAHQTRDADYPQRLGSVPADSLAYFLGEPLVGGGVLGRNYSRADAAVAEACVALLAAFAKGPAPGAGPGPGGPGPDPVSAAGWPRYELSTQQYLSIGSKVRVRSHYRGHKMALWLHLVPQLHRPGAGTAPQHHQLRQQHPHMFAGDVFPELYETAAALDEAEGGHGAEAEAGAEGEAEAEVEEDAEAGEGAGTGGDGVSGPECSPSPPPPALPAQRAPHPALPEPRDQPLSAHYYSYTVALGVTVGAGCFLLALNVLVFAGIYLQRGRERDRDRGARGHRRDRDRDRARDRDPTDTATATARSLHGVCGDDAGGGGGGGGGGECAGEAALAAASPRKSTLKRSRAAELTERPPGPGCTPAPAPKKRVHIQEISV